MRFDAERCLRDFQMHLLEALRVIRRDFMEEAKSHMRDSRAVEDLSEGEIRGVAGWIAVTVIGGPWVVMDEWGKGSLMDRTNPALAAYVEGEMFNRARLEADYAILGRPAGQYTDIFGVQRTSSGAFEGHNLEIAAREGNLDGDFIPQPPSKALQITAEWIKTERLALILQSAVNSFPWGSYVVVFKD